MNPSSNFLQTNDISQPDRPENTAPIPLIEEQVQVSKQWVETGRTTLVKTVHEVDETVTVPLLRNEFVIERVALDEYVDEVPPTRQEGNTTIYSIVKEVLVVQKRLLLVEEVRVTQQQSEEQETQTVRLRKEQLTVERIPNIPNPERQA